jgi:hypothetical protein
MSEQVRILLALVALLSACGGAPPPPMVTGDVASGVALPCYHVISPGQIPMGRRYRAVDEQGLLQTVEVTRSELDEPCLAADEPSYAICFEDLSAQPMIAEGSGQAYARCTDTSGLFGSHAVGRVPQGVVLLVAEDFALGNGARVLRPLHNDLLPPPPSDHPFVALDADGDGAPDHLVFTHGVATDTRDPDHSDLHFGSSCLDVYALVHGAWSQLYSACAETCQPVTY